MAYANNTGLNEISALGAPIVKNKQQQLNPESCGGVMDPKHSRIPKFSFSIKKTNGEKKPSPGSSPVARSKSMKVQRTTTPLVQRRPKHSNSIDNDQEQPDGPQTNLLQTPSRLNATPKSQPGSRSTTPIGNDNSTGGFTRSMTVSSTNRYKDTPTTAGWPQEVNGIKTHVRSSSFSAKDKHNVIPTPIKRPTVHSQIPDYKSRVKAIPQPHHSDSPKQLKRTFSNPKTSYDENDGNIESSHSKQGSGILRSPDSRKSSVGSQNGGRRPSSMISFTEKSSGLNELASEITQMGDSHVFGSAPPRIPSSKTARGTGSMSSNRQVQVKTDASVISKLRPPIARNVSDEGNRPSSAANYHRNESRNVSRPRSAADMHKITTTPSQQPPTVVSTRRSSTPSSGRTTPQLNIQKSIAEEEGTGVPLTTPRRQIGAHTRVGRTPFFRSAKSTSVSYRTGGGGGGTLAAEDAVGLNELEGAVLLDAEDYRRMLQEVKALKSVLLRLKRELAADGGTTVSPSSKSGVKAENTDKNSELSKEIEKLVKEKDKAKNDLESSQKKHEVAVAKVEKLQEELEGSKKENEDLKQKLQFLESHRESLLDKVERLHADKHKLEDRLNSLEKSVMYESTVLNDDWMEGGDLYDDSINNGYDYDDEDATY